MVLATSSSSSLEELIEVATNTLVETQVHIIVLGSQAPEIQIS